MPMPVLSKNSAYNLYYTFEIEKGCPKSDIIKISWFKLFLNIN